MAGGKKHQGTPESELANIKQQKDKIMENIERIKTSFRQKTISFNTIELECRLDILNKYIDDAMRLQSELDSLDPGNEDRAELEDLCVSTKSLFLAMLAKNRRNSIPETSFSAPQHQSRLPNMRLPKFSGRYSEYKNFIGLFENLVHADPTLTDIEKFNHLISCLSDEALGTVKAFQISEENYPKALASLKKVYDNECLIFSDNIAKLFDLPEIIKPSASALRSMIDTVSAIYDSLLSIGDDKKITNAILIHLVMSKVDSVTKSKWEEQLDYEKLPLWADCEAALNKRYQHIAAEESSGTRSKSLKPKFDNQSKKSYRSSLMCSRQKQSPEKCLFCRSTQHNITNCSSFTTVPVLQRFEFVKAIPACINCLKKGHTVAKCNSGLKCRVCNSSHHHLLHRYASDIHEIGVNHEQPTTSNASVNHSTSNDCVILATALVRVRSRSGEHTFARALLDSGSQTNLITEELVQRLKVKRFSGRLNLTGISNLTSSSKNCVQLSVMSRFNQTQFSSKFWVLKSITSLQPDNKISISDWNIPGNIELADPSFNEPRRIDLLIGAEVFFDLLCVGQIRPNPSLPILQKTSLGWVVAGKYDESKGSCSTVCQLSSSIENEEVVDDIVRKFWQLEELPNPPVRILSEEQQKCETHFLKNIRRLPSGRFQVSLPFKGDIAELGLSFETARRRFLALERKLSRDETSKGMYNDFMEEYLRLGHMEATDNNIPESSHYFIPHQFVFRPQSTTTKLRVVFDASSKTSTNISLNDILMVGPTIQEELYSTLLRFRMHKYVVTADIEKMYRQVLIDEKQRDVQLILWRKNASDPLQIFRLKTVTYGTSSAPFLAIRCLSYLSDLYKGKYPIGADVIRNDFYVDDLLTGAADLNGLLKIRDQVSTILSSAGFNLTKWLSNHPEIHGTSCTEKLLHSESETARALGINWAPKSDVFKFSIEGDFQDMKATKRHILSVSSRLFDPLGLLCPAITKVKMLLQELWVNKLDWDESIPMRLHSVWEDFKCNLSKLNTIEIPRFVNTSESARIQIHGFSDASMRAYGCCFYVRVVDAHGVHCRLLTAKSRVAPLKTISLPRLELSAAHLMSKIWVRIKPLINFHIDNVFFWSDSEITLYWLRTHPSALATFVSNRVAETQEWSDKAVWRHVPTMQNPADIVSRGCNIDDLKASMWFTGPKFLLDDSSKWPVNKHFELTEEQKSLETRKSKVLVTAHSQIDEEGCDDIILQLVVNHSSYKRLLRVVAYIFRFIDRSRRRKVPRSLCLTAQELNWAFFKVVEAVQKCSFSEEISNIKKSRSLQPCLQKLTPFIHDFSESNRSFSLLRVGGRLLNAPLPYHTKFPLLLPKKHHFVSLYLRNLHLDNCHAGTKALVALSRERIWLINAREECSRVVRNCVHCYRYKPKLMTQIMGNLPTDRVRAVRPFLIVGVDFCGPVEVTLKVRGRPPTKMYIAIFVCFTSKAVHIELVSDLSSDSFILCFKRFVARRGLPSKIYCDNATNFVGASRSLKDLQEAFLANRGTVEEYAAALNVQFNFIPPRAPHFGGLWEAAVKQAKYLLLRIVGKALLTQEEMSTMLAEVEAVLNSRPIAPLSQDPNDGEALTPGHLLIGTGLRSLPPESVDEDSVSKLRFCKRWRMLSALKQAFWRAWSRDYILELQGKGKWNLPQPNLEVGRLVLIHEDNLPPQEWLTGRVMSVTEGNDGKVRVAEVITKTGVYKRPISKLAPLPIH